MRYPAAFLLLGFAGIGHSQLLRGTYEVRMRTPGSKVAVPQPPGTPAAQIRHFVVDGKRWMLYDMKVGFQGAYSLKGNVATLTTTLKAVKGKGTQAMVFDVSKDRKTLTGRPAKGLPTVLQFVWKTPGVFVRMPK